MKTKRGNEFYAQVVDLMGNEPRSTTEMYEILTLVEEDKGENDNLVCSKILDKLVEIQGDNIEVTLDKTKKNRGRQVPRIYKLIGELDEAQVKIAEYFKNPAKRTKTIAPAKLMAAAIALDQTKLPALKKLKQKQEEKQTQEETTEPMNVDGNLMLIVSILKEAKRSVCLFDMCACLKEKFKVILNKQEILDICKSNKEINVINGNYLSLKDVHSGEKIYDSYKQQTSRQIYARIGMSLEEVQKYIPSTSCKYKISEEDGIYEITIDATNHSLINLINLYQTFRGNDEIFGEKELIRKMDMQIDFMRNLWKSHNKRFMLEEQF